MLQWLKAKPFAVVLFTIVSITYLIWAAVALLSPLRKGLEAGTFGDWFGALNALFSGLAFVGLILTMRAQREELALQRTDLELNTTAVREQKHEMHLQALALQNQVRIMNRAARLAALPELLEQVERRINANSQWTLGTVEHLQVDQLDGFKKQIEKSKDLAAAEIRKAEQEENMAMGTDAERTTTKSFRGLLPAQSARLRLLIDLGQLIIMRKDWDLLYESCYEDEHGSLTGEVSEAPSAAAPTEKIAAVRL
jgi:hypothetical protein